MSWIEPIDTTRSAFRYASFDGENWSEPTTIVSGSDLFTNRADIPKVHPLSGGRFAAHYMVSSGSHYFAYDLKIKRSKGDGTWEGTLTPHQDQTAAQHGFASIVPWRADQLFAVWLDGRDAKPVAGEYDESEWGNMSLRSALIGPSGTIKQRTRLDQRVCECCATSGVRTSDGVLIAYRDRSEQEVRDINLLRFDGKKWSDSYRLHNDGWTIGGCPVNGPALASSGDRVVAGWFTAADNNPRVQVAFSDDGGRTFGPPMVVDDGRPDGRVDVVLLDDGSALVSWSGLNDGKTAIKVRRVDEHQGTGAESTIVEPQSPAFVGTPQMARSGSSVYVAWGDGGDPDETVIQLARPSIKDFK